MRPPVHCRVALVEDHVLFAESMEIALRAEGHDVRRIALPDAVRAPSTLLPAILRAHPQIVLLDLDLGPLGNGARLVQPLARAGIATIVVTGSRDRVRWGEALRQGAQCVLAKDVPLNDILATIRRVRTGQAAMDHEERETLLRLWHEQRQHLGHVRMLLESLTPRESEVLGHLMAGRQVREIAELSVVSEATIRTQVKSILTKLEVSSQLAAVGAAYHAEWHPPSTSRSLQVH